MLYIKHITKVILQYPYMYITILLHVYYSTQLYPYVFQPKWKITVQGSCEDSDGCEYGLTKRAQSYDSDQ